MGPTCLLMKCFYIDNIVCAPIVPISVIYKKDVYMGKVARKNATYSWPWENTSLLTLMLTYLKVCPWDLLIVITYTSWTGNYLRLTS